MRKQISLVLAGSLGAVGLAIGCDDSPPPGETSPGQKVENAMERTGEAIERGARKAGEYAAPIVDSAVEESRKAADKLAERLDRFANPQTQPATNPAAN